MTPYVRILTVLLLALLAPASQAAEACSTHTATCFTRWVTGPESSSASCGGVVTPDQPCVWAWDATGQSPVLRVRDVGSLTFEVPSTLSGSVEVWHCANTTYTSCTQLQLRDTAGVFQPVELDATTTTGEGAETHAYWILNATGASGSVTVTAGQ